MADLSAFSKNDLKILRKVVKKIHHIHFPDVHAENWQLDMIIDSLLPDTVARYLEQGKRSIKDFKRGV